MGSGGWATRAAADARLLAAARDGDTDAFASLVMPHRRALHLHCYRLLGSLADAGEATGEALLRARRGLRGYRADQPLQAWLLRITTVTCLRADGRRTSRPETLTDAGRQVQPYPDALLAQLTDPTAPAARRTLDLPFITRLQLLPAAQRAAIVLREVLTWPIEDVARTLGVSVTTAERSLDRARETLAGARAAQPGSAEPTAAGEDVPGEDVPGEDVRRDDLPAAFSRAWRDQDVPALAGLLEDDVTVTMPGPTRLRGREAVTAFLESVSGGAGRLAAVETRANGRPALALYLARDPGFDAPDPPAGLAAGGEQADRYRSWALVVLTVRAGRLADLTGFADEGLFQAFGLPTTLRGARQTAGPASAGQGSASQAWQVSGRPPL